MTITQDQRLKMIEAAKPLMAWMDSNCHPHCAATVDQTTVELSESIALGHISERQPVQPADVKAEEVTLHHVGPFNSKIKVCALHDRGPGGAHTHYEISVNSANGPAPIAVEFQNGNPDLAITGYSNEAFLAMLIHRMQGFAQGPFTCPANDVILDHLEKALALMHDRTNERLSRGVHGQTTK